MHEQPVKNNTPMVMPTLDLHQKCPACNGLVLKDKFEVVGYQITRCQTCTVWFVRQKIPLELLKIFYQDQPGYCFYEDDNKDCLNYYNLKLKREIETLKPEKGKILDLGCNSGFFLEAMEGWERHGVEISEEYGGMARKRIGDTIFVGAFERYPLKKEYFDVITLLDVFDHLNAPGEILEKCRAMLRPGGVIVIKVHNTECLFAKLAGKSFYALIPPIHLFYYNEKPLKYLLGKTGYTHLKTKSIGHQMRVKTILHRLSRSGEYEFLYRIYRLVAATIAGNIKVYKNFNDIITVFAAKK